MAIPGFLAATLNEYGGPAWIDELATADRNHLLHVVRGLAPVEAVELVGGTVLSRLTPNELPAQRLDEWSTVAHASVGADSMEDLLVAGRRGDWTFVYDTSGVTAWTREHRNVEMTRLLSADGRAAATSIRTINANVSMYYAENGENTFAIHEPYDPEYDEQETPDVLRPAIAAAGSIDSKVGRDVDVNMRIICALAGLTWTVDEFRAQPLFVAEVTSSSFYDVLKQMDQPRRRDAPGPPDK